MVSRKIKAVEESATHQPRHEMLQVADMVAREKGIERDEVIVALELAILKTAKSKYGNEIDVRVQIDRQTGNTIIFRVLTVADPVENPLIEISPEDALKDHGVLDIGEEIFEILPPIDFGRMAAQSARQIIIQKVRDAERSRQYEEYKERVGDIINGTIKRIEFGNVIVDLGKAEAILRRDDVIPRENFRPGDRVRALITELRPDAKGPMITLSRTHPHFMAKLFEQEVPEIYEGIIEIRSVARDSGSRAKIAVCTSDSSIDPVGACVGMRGSRVQAVVNELQGEKIDIILWSENPATFVVNALAPAEILKVVIDEEMQRVDVIVPDDQLSLAIGRRGQNVRLASQLTGWSIDIVNEVDDTNRRNAENAQKLGLFIEALAVDDMIGQLLVSEGFSNLEEIAYVDVSEFTNIEGFDEEIAVELQSRARQYLEQKGESVRNQCKESGMHQELIDLTGMTLDILGALLKNNILTLDDLGELSADEFLELLPAGCVTVEAANAMIMAARAHWFADTEK